MAELLLAVAVIGLPVVGIVGLAGLIVWRAKHGRSTIDGRPWKGTDGTD